MPPTTTWVGVPENDCKHSSPHPPCCGSQGSNLVAKLVWQVPSSCAIPMQSESNQTEYSTESRLSKEEEEPQEHSWKPIHSVRWGSGLPSAGGFSWPHLLGAASFSDNQFLLGARWPWSNCTQNCQVMQRGTSCKDLEHHPVSLAQATDHTDHRVHSPGHSDGLIHFDWRKPGSRGL